jgi:hypothetical protein
MPRIRCRYVDCIYLESGFCGTDQIDLDPELGCLTYTQEEEDLGIDKEEEWEEDKVLDEEEEDEEWDEEELEDEELDDDDSDEDEEDW